MSNYIDIINFDWESAEIGVCHDGFGFVSAIFSDGQNEIKISSIEAVSMVRLKAYGLKADCDYMVTVNYPEGEELLKFKTLPAPQGDLLGSYAVLSDPHISSKQENRKGRLFVESAQILNEVFLQCDKLNVDFALIAGDLTNNSEREEFEVLKKILKEVKSPLICAPGDHDLIPDNALWNEYLKDKNLLDFSNDFFKVKAIDSSKNILTTNDALRLESMLNDKRMAIILTHVHLLQNDKLKYSPKAGGIENHSDYQELFEAFSWKNSIIYAGHQNIPTQIPQRKLRQINLPQTCQFPCAWYYVRVFPNGLYHKSMPITSEILRQQSRIDSQRAAEYFAEPQWQTEYRRGETATAGNFLIKWI